MPCVGKGCKGTHKFFKQAGTGYKLNKTISFTEYEIKYLHHIVYMTVCIATYYINTSES